MKAIYAILIAAFVALVGIAATHKPTPHPGICHVNGQLPDPVCTPGVTNPNVNQANIQSNDLREGLDYDCSTTLVIYGATED